MWEVFTNDTNCDSSLQVWGRYSHHLVFQNHSLLTSESLLPLHNLEQGNNTKVGKDMNSLKSCAWTKALECSANTSLDHSILYNKE